LLAIEEPLQFCLNGSPISITLPSPGSDLDLAVGFLFTEGIISDVRQMLSMRAESGEDISGDSGDRVTVGLRPGIAIDPGRIR
jgi:FdhD protein